MILASIDLGSGHLACIVVDAKDPWAPTAPLFAKTLYVGRKVVLAEPIVRPQKDGSTRTQTHKREVTPADEMATARAVVDVVRAHRVDVLLIESVARVRATGNAAADSGIATSIMVAERVGGILVGVLSAGDGPRVRVEHVTARTWRAALLRHLRRYPLAPGRGVPPTPPVQTAALGGHLLPLLRAQLPGLPVGTSDHVHAAGGLLLSRVLDCPASKAAKRGKPREPRTKAGALTPCAVCGVTWEAHPMARDAGHPFATRIKATSLAAVKRAARLAAGCTCPNHHRRACPLYVPRWTHRGAPIGLDPLDALLGLTAPRRPPSSATQQTLPPPTSTPPLLSYCSPLADH